MTKNVISRETCQKELVAAAKGELISDAVLLAVILLIFVPLTCVGIYLIRFIAILGILCALVCSIPL